MIKLKKWIIPLTIIALLLFIAALFLTPSFTRHCTEDLFICMEDASKNGFWQKLWSNLSCVYHNVVCVLGGLFI